MHSEVSETLVYTLIHIKGDGVVENSTKPAPKILMFIAGAVSALPYPLGLTHVTQDSQFQLCLYDFPLGLSPKPQVGFCCVQGRQEVPGN